MQRGRVVFVGAGPGDPELITVRGRNYLEDADVVIYAGSLVNPDIVRRWARKDAEVVDSASLTLVEITELMIRRAKEGKLVVRLKSGDFSIYGALMEEIWALQDAEVPYELVPGITAALSAASVAGIELTLPKVSQTLIITRGSARVQMEGSIRDYAPFVNRGASLAIYTGVHIVDKVVRELKEGGVTDDTPVVVVYKAGWPDQKIVRTTVDQLVSRVKEEKIFKDAVIIVGKVANPERYRDEVRSSVYDPSHAHSFRPKRREE